MEIFEMIKVFRSRDMVGECFQDYKKYLDVSYDIVPEIIYYVVGEADKLGIAGRIDKHFLNHGAELEEIIIINNIDERV